MAKSSQSRLGEKNAKLVKRFWNEVWNPPYSMETFDELVAENFVISTDGRCVEGKEPFRKWLSDFQSKIDQLTTSPKEVLVAEGGLHIITRMVVSGLNKGLFGTNADQSEVKFVAISIMEVRDGKLVYNWVERSAFELFKRLTRNGTN
jgi:predicted ester cyclase